MQKILIVDDEKEIRDLIEIYLKSEGYETLKAADGEEALKILSMEEPDLIILDVMMPKMNGIDACLKIREERQMPIIMLSAKSEDVDKILGLNMGADDYLTKPFSYNELNSRVKALLRRYHIYQGKDHSIKQESVLNIGKLKLDTNLKTAFKDVTILKQIDNRITNLQNTDVISSSVINEIQLGTGSINITINLMENLFIVL